MSDIEARVKKIIAEQLGVAESEVTPEKAFVAAAPRDGERALAVVTGADDVAVLAAEDVAGRSVTIGEDGGAVLGCSN